ncbi:MAG: sulfur carrier protein ThiS [Planctomycetota bacterium]
MQIRVNGEAREVPDGASVGELVAIFQLAAERVAVEVNERLVRRAVFGQTRLQPGDRVEIVTLVGGG